MKSEEIERLFSPLPVIESFTLPVFEDADVSVECLRLDQVHPEISGNKWYKLKYHLAAALNSQCREILSFGGAYSNHLHALAYVGKALELKTSAIVRGEMPAVLSPTLQDCQHWGMSLHWLSRKAYRELVTEQGCRKLRQAHPEAWVIPEGGEGEYGVAGVQALFSRLFSELDKEFDYLACSVGSGTTLAGIIRAAPASMQVTGFSALKGAIDLEARIARQLSGHDAAKRWRLYHDYHFGGFAKLPESLAAWIDEVWRLSGVLLDPVYTGKMLFGLQELVKNQRIKRGSRVLCIHTGGLQGWRGFPAMRPAIGDHKE